MKFNQLMFSMILLLAMGTNLSSCGVTNPTMTSTPTTSTIQTKIDTIATCPQGSYQLQDPGSGLPFQITSGGTGTVLTINSSNSMEINYSDYEMATGTTRGGSFSMDVKGVITAKLLKNLDGTFSVADVDASGITGQQTVTLNGGGSFTISGSDFTDIAIGLSPFGAGTVINCTATGDIQASAGSISQIYIRR